MYMVDNNEQTPQEMCGQKCPICGKDTLTLRDAEREVPYFGIMYIFSMDCSSCNYHKADVEFDANQEPSKYELEISEEKDLKTRIIKSSTAKIKLGRIGSIDPGATSNGYVTNVEGLLNRFKNIIEMTRDNAENDSERKQAKNHLKKISRVIWGSEKIKLVLEDPKGNSAIISDKAVKTKLKIK